MERSPVWVFNTFKLLCGHGQQKMLQNINFTDRCLAIIISIEDYVMGTLICLSVYLCVFTIIG